MKRKIIKQGHNTLTITLPVEWTKRFNLEAGREIDIDERDNGLFISTEKNGKHRKAEFSIAGMDIPTIWKYFMAVYREGYDEVLVKFDPKEELENPYKFYSHHRIDLKYKRRHEKLTSLEAVQNFANRFIDFEIVEQGKDYALIKEMGELTSKEFDNSMRRVFLLLQQMAEETAEAIKTGNTKLVMHMHDVDINLDKFHDYCIRILNRAGNKDPRKTSLLFATLYLLELIGDEFKNVSHHLLRDYPKKKFSNIGHVGESVKGQFESFYDLFYKFSREKIIALSETDKTNYQLIPKIYKESKEEEKAVLHHLRMISRYINALTELRIEMEF